MDENKQAAGEPEIIDARPDTAKMTKAELKEFADNLLGENESLIRESERAQAEAEQAKRVAIQAAEFQTLYTRLRSDFDNYKRRNAGINDRAKEEATVALAEKLLPVLDNFGRALEAISDENTLVGIRMIFNQFNEILEHMNVRKYESLGTDFDHNLHDAVMMQETGPEQAGKVLTVLSEGYRYGDRVIRAAKVIVGREPESTGEPAQS